MNARQHLLIDNQWVSTTERLPVVNPFTGEEFASAPLGNRDHIAAAIAAAHAAFPNARATPAHARARLLLKVAALIDQRREEFVLCELILVELYMQLRNPSIFAKPYSARESASYCLALKQNPAWRCVDYDPLISAELWAWAELM